MGETNTTISLLQLKSYYTHINSLFKHNAFEDFGLILIHCL
jgi:hypothetical protein